MIIDRDFPLLGLANCFIWPLCCDGDGDNDDGELGTSEGKRLRLWAGLCGLMPSGFISRRP